MGRLGPHYATVIGSNEMGLGGDIFPSGHTANAVVTWGILAYLASTPAARRWLSAASAVTSLGVGLATVYLGTHWLSDVLLGWAAGLLVLLALPWCEPLIARAETSIFDLRDRWRARRGRTAPAPAPAAPVTAPVLLKPRASSGDEVPAARETVTTSRSARPPAHLAPSPHTTRSERTPVTPIGSRRPPHPDRVARATGTPAPRPVPGG
jgi:hypothetical protein